MFHFNHSDHLESTEYQRRSNNDDLASGHSSVFSLYQREDLEYEEELGNPDRFTFNNHLDESPITSVPSNQHYDDYAENRTDGVHRQTTTGAKTQGQELLDAKEFMDIWNVGKKNFVRCKVCQRFPEIVRRYCNGNRPPPITEAYGTQYRSKVVLDHVGSRFHVECVKAQKLVPLLSNKNEKTDLQKMVLGAVNAERRF